MLGAAYVATRTLWVPIGLHLAWNFAETGIFGILVCAVPTVLFLRAASRRGRILNRTKQTAG